MRTSQKSDEDMTDNSDFSSEKFKNFQNSGLSSEKLIEVSTAAQKNFVTED